jgi:hypothetical protein
MAESRKSSHPGVHLLSTLLDYQDATGTLTDMRRDYDLGYETLMALLDRLKRNLQEERPADFALAAYAELFVISLRHRHVCDIEALQKETEHGVRRSNYQDAAVKIAAQKRHARSVERNKKYQIRAREIKGKRNKLGAWEIAAFVHREYSNDDDCPKTVNGMYRILYDK